MFKRAEPLLRRLAPTSSAADRAVPVLTEVLAPGDPSKSRVSAADLASRQPEPSLRSPGLSLDDAGEFAERLRGRLNDYLRKDGRDLIELRCRKMLDEHAAKMVEQISGEVTLMLEIQIRQWVYEGIVEALERNGDGR